MFQIVKNVRHTRIQTFLFLDDYVEVCHLGYCRSGVVRWLGDAVSEDNDHIEKSAVVELVCIFIHLS